MTCLNDSDFERLHNDGSTVEDQTALMRHLEGCEVCRKKLERYQADQALVPMVRNLLKEAQQTGNAFYFAKENSEACVGKILLGMEDMEPFAESGQIGDRLNILIRAVGTIMALAGLFIPIKEFFGRKKQEPVPDNNLPQQ